MSVLLVLLLSLLSSVGISLIGAQPAAAATGNILPPFDTGQTWNICQGYNGSVSHTGTSLDGLDLTGTGCNSDAAGRNVRAPIAGTVSYWQASYGNLCINLASGGSYTLTHIDATITSGSVTAGQLVGTVAAAGTRNNNGLAHLHFQIWGAPNCYNSTVIPFDAAHNTRICGAPDLTTSGPIGTAGQGVWSGTSFVGSTCGATSSGYYSAFQANTAGLFIYNSAGPNTTNSGNGMMSGTNPSVATLSSGYVTAFQANTGTLYTYNSAGPVTASTGQGMMSGTSPAITALSGGGYEVAFQANNGNLYLYNSSSGAASTGQGMMSGTSPSITALSGGGFEVAFQANNGNLYVYSSSSGAASTGAGMKAGTSPAIASSGGGFQVAFQANTGNLFTYSSTGPTTTNTGQGMMAGTSPSIAALSSGGYESAFQANSGNLYVYNSSSGAASTGAGMKTGTSPAIAASSSGGFQVAFQANTGNLFTYSSTGPATADSGQGMMSGTSPAIAAQ